MANIILPGTAQPSNVLTGEAFCAGTNFDTAGTMPNIGGANLTPSGTGTVTIPAGYHDGTGVVEQVNVPAGSVLAGTTIAGVAGTIPIASTTTPVANYSWSLSGTYLNVTPPYGYYNNGAETYVDEPNLVPGNIAYGKSIFGVAGSFGNVRVASGSGSLSSTGSSFTKTTGGSLTAPSATVPVPSGATRIHAVIVVSTSNSESPPFSGVAGTGYQSLTIASALGYMDGGDASTLAVMHSTEYGWNSFASGGVLSVSASSIVLPAVATNYGDTFYYTVIWD